MRSYPKGLGILKEFIQNADDAEADEIVFVIDEQQYDIAGLPDSMQWLHTTPALLVYNNRSFSESDIQGIQNIGESGKSESVGKTGRFGLGFNACYNVTDVPCFFTRGDLHFFDPHFQTLQQASLESPGRRFSIDELIGEGWPLLDAFRQFVVDGSGFDGTVFRLPFRTAQQASTSKIKKDAYMVSDALDAVHELQEMGSAILLFLKHIRRLKVERRNRDGSVVDLLSMQATNPKEILKSRAEVNDLLSSPDPDRILTELSGRGQVYSSCRHEYSVVAEGVEHTETWRVIDGFFADDEHQVVSACRKMIQNEEKALPYAGAAWPLDPGRRAAGRIFCFLPVPMQTNMPIQINGYFDLDDSRQNMFLDPSAHGAAGHRVQWNKALLENSIVQAYIRLMEDLRSDLGADRIDSYYSAFPRAVDNEVSWEGWLTAAFYKQASMAALFKVSGDTPWSVLAATRSLPRELLSVGDALIAEDFLPIPYPSLPAHVRKGFISNGIDVPELSPQDLRIRLKEQRDVDCLIDTAPRACLRKREYIEQIFRFCLSDSPDAEGIHGLPLVIDCRDHIRTLGLTEFPLYLGQTWDLEIFRDHSEWFVELKLAKDLDLVETEGVRLLEMDSKRFVRELSNYVTAQAGDGNLKMTTGKDGAFTDEWLQAVFNRLLESDLDKLVDDIRKIPLIPDQSRVLYPVGLYSTPLLFRVYNEDLKRALIELSFPLVTGVSRELFKLLIDFSEKKKLLWQVTPCDLVDTLADRCSEVIKKHDQFTEVHGAILDYLSRDESLAELKKYPNRQDKLKSLMLFPASKGDFVDLSSIAYVSQNFAFPSVDFKVVLLDYRQSHQWRNFYILLGARELSRSRLIRELLLPGFKQLDAADRVEASSWLRDNLSIAQSEDETYDSDGLFVEVRNTPFVVCEDGELRAPMSVYQPESKLASAVLGDQAAFPDMDTYANSRERWLEFFRQLDMPTEPRLADVVKYVRKLITDTPYDQKTNPLQAVYKFIKGRVDAEIQEKKDVSDELSDVLEELSDIPWIPIRQEASNLLCFKPPEVAFACPGDVYFPRIGQLVASQAFITILKPEPNNLTRKAMGFPVKPPVELVVKHFQEVLAACSTHETMPDQSVLVGVLAQIYRFLGGKAPRDVDELDEDIEYQDTYDMVDLETKFSEIPCIWDQEKKCFWRPDHVFTDNVRYMEPWRRTIRSSEDAVERGYTSLGRRQEPTIEDWKQVLKEISESGKSLSTYEVEEVIYEVVRRIVKELDSEDATDGAVLVPTRNWRMLPAETVFIADAPWYESMLDAWDIPILSSFVSGIWGIHRVLGIPSLADSIKQRIIEYPSESDLDDKNRECSRLGGLLRSDEFILGLQRLLQHEGHDVSENSLSNLREVDVRCVKAIKTCLYLQFDGTERLLGDDEASSYWDNEALQAMLAENRYRYFCNDLAEMLNRALGNSLKNLAPLVHVLRCEPSEISEVLDDLKIRKYSYVLEEKPEDDTEVVPQEFPDDENEIVDQYECEKSEVSKALVPDDDDPVDENKPDNDEVGYPSDYSEQGERSGQPHGISTGTSSRWQENGQPSALSRGGWPSGASGSRNPGGTGVSGPGSGTAERSDMERGQSTDGTGGSLSQSTASSLQPTAQRRLLSYVSHGGRDGDWSNTLSGGDSRSLSIGKAAVEIVIEHEKRNGRKARPMAHSNAGYDVISECDGETRYIEVKGTEAAWGERGVVLTPTQFFYVRENPDRDHWLYVVEEVFSQTPPIHKIHNPSEKVGFFVFDGGWSQVAESAQGKGVQMPIPSPGDEVLLNGNVVGIVEAIRRAGKFPLVLYRAPDGTLHKKLLADVMVRSKEEV